MKKLILVTVMLLLNSCNAQINHKKQYKFNTMFETFDFVKFENENEKYKKHEYSDEYIFKDKGLIRLVSPEYICIIPPNSFFSIFKNFYENGNINSKGKYFGELDMGDNYNRFGYWYYFDEKGNLIKEVDEDKKFGKFSYNEVLKFLDSKKDINLNTGEGRDKFEVQYYYSDKSTKKLWKVFVKIGEPYDGPPPPGYKYEKGETISYSYQKGKYYYLDGDTGEQIKTTDKRLLDYKEIIPDFEEKFPKLIESTVVHKTYEGKDYTESEWKAYEEKEYEAFCKRTGRPYTPKSQSQESTLRQAQDDKTQGYKSPFLADDFEKGDDNTPKKKKGFWG